MSLSQELSAPTPTYIIVAIILQTSRATVLRGYLAHIFAC